MDTWNKKQTKTTEFISRQYILVSFKVCDMFKNCVTDSIVILSELGKGLE